MIRSVEPLKPVPVLGITGANGFMALHLRALCASRGDFQVELADRQTFSDPSRLSAFVRACDVVVHLAGLNRSPELVLEETNVQLVESLLEASQRANHFPHFIFASSTHIERETAYGRSKKKGAELFAKHAAKFGCPFSNIIFPNIFGEYGRPFYNSVVATFCHQLATGENPKIESDGLLHLLHVQDAVGLLYETALGKRAKHLSPPGVPMRVRELLDRLKTISELYSKDQFGDLSDPLTLNLFNTYRSYLFPSFYPKKLSVHADPRGNLVETIKSASGGQAFVSTSHPGIIRGNHFHLRKVERFVVLRGTALVKLRRLFSNDVISLCLEGDKPAFLDIPTLYSHSIENVGKEELLTLFWANEVFDPRKPDTFAEQVLKAA
jgi:UDP-2-acetamido-2,6-beta-L-arabino-hexul-4-ose reductase